MEIDTVGMTLQEYIDYMDVHFSNYKSNDLLGFTIGNGRKVYWYFSPNCNSGNYRILPVEQDGSLGWPQYIYSDQIVHIVRKKTSTD